MAVPKRRTSKARHRKRFAQWALGPVKLVRCRHCGERHRPHEVCPYCGHYHNRHVTEPRLKAAE
ncbi:MAG: 50S ribosomal protein L32 [Armatimonadetes bacterium]|nr:50S ribosomal protein L32 [Armatimonadota bacterium]